MTKRAYIPYQNTGGSVPGWLSGEIRFYVYDPDALSCDDAEAQFLSLNAQQKVAATVGSEPAALTDKEFTNRDCSVDAWPTYATVNNSEYIPPEINNPDPDPNPAPGPAIPLTASRVAGMNPEIFKPTVSWSNGKARILNESGFSGGTIQYYFCGQPPVTALPSTYDYSPGDVVTLVLGVSNSPYVYQSAWNQKSMFTVKIGPAPN